MGFLLRDGKMASYAHQEIRIYSAGRSSKNRLLQESIDGRLNAEEDFQDDPEEPLRQLDRKLILMNEDEKRS